jgi:hypothetical protein
MHFHRRAAIAVSQAHDVAVLPIVSKRTSGNFAPRIFAIASVMQILLTDSAKLSVAGDGRRQCNALLYAGSMTNSPVLVAGAGIRGLSVTLTLHQIGVPCLVFESVPEIKPLGVGINLQPNAVRELYELGFGPEALDTIWVQTREWVLVSLNGNEVYSEWCFCD